jgi:hypothetical protein
MKGFLESEGGSPSGRPAPVDTPALISSALATGYDKLDTTRMQLNKIRMRVIGITIFVI